MPSSKIGRPNGFWGPYVPELRLGKREPGCGHPGNSTPTYRGSFGATIRLSAVVNVGNIPSARRGLTGLGRRSGTVDDRTECRGGDWQSQ